MGRRQDDCKIFSKPLMVSLSNHQRLERSSFDKLRMTRHQRAALLCDHHFAIIPEAERRNEFCWWNFLGRRATTRETVLLDPLVLEC